MPKLLRTLTLIAVISFSLTLLPTYASRNGTDGNLLENGDFESGSLDPWSVCGGAKLIDKDAAGSTPDMVHGGRYALRLGSPTDDPNSCGTDALGPVQVVAEDVTIPSAASDITVSFWYRAMGDWPVGALLFSLTSKPRSYAGAFSSIDTIKMENLMPGWHFYRQNIRQGELATLRGKTVYLSIQIDFRQRPEWNWAIHLDDIRIAPARELVTSAPLPAELIGDGTRPLVVTGAGVTNGTYALYRMDTDGSNRSRLTADTVNAPRLPVWSPDGTRIVYQDDTSEPALLTDPKLFQAQINRLYLINADGSNERQIFKSLGRAGRKDEPLGCVRTGGCSDPGLDAIDGFITDMHWSPDAKQMAATFCFRARWYNGDKDIGDAQCFLTRHDLPPAGNFTTLGVERFVDEAHGSSWSKENKLLFVAGPGLTTRKKGVWELELSTQPTQTVQLYTWLTEAGGGVDFRLNPDDTPTWSPDGTKFVVYRKNPSNHYAPINDTVGGLWLNYSIILYERANLTTPRHLLLVDQGTLVGRPIWSPDGRFILYVVTTDDEESTDIWWLRVATGETGRLTNTGGNFAVDWQPTHRLSQPTATATAQATGTPDPALNRRVYLAFVSRSASPSATPGAGPTPIVFATLTPTAAPTAIATPANPTAVPPRGISGRVLYKGVGVAGITVQLETCFLDAPCTMKVRTKTDTNGVYAFPTAPSSRGILGYYVTYRNGAPGDNPDDPRYLRYWQSQQIPDYDYAERVHGGTFDIANVELVTADNANLTLPATFTWNSRGVSGDQYSWGFQEDLFDGCSPASGSESTSFVFTSLDCQFPNLRYDTPYHWYVQVIQSGENGGAGESRVRTVTFVE